MYWLLALVFYSLNAGFVFLQCNPMCSSKDSAEYPTLYCIRNTASKRYTAKNSLKLFNNILLSWARDDAVAEEAKIMEIINLSHSPAVTQPRKLTLITEQSTHAVRMLCV